MRRSAQYHKNKLIHLQLSKANIICTGEDLSIVELSTIRYKKYFELYVEIKKTIGRRVSYEF